jgi:hypothetical protein
LKPRLEKNRKFEQRKTKVNVNEPSSNINFKTEGVASAEVEINDTTFDSLESKPLSSRRDELGNNTGI